MKESERKKFVEKLEAVLAVYGVKLHALAEPLWWETLQDLPWREVEAAFGEHLRRNYSAPVPENIRDKCHSRLSLSAGTCPAPKSNVTSLEKKV